MTDNAEYQLIQQQLAATKRKYELMQSVAFELNKVLSLPDKLQNILELLHNRFHIDYSMILLPDSTHHCLEVKGSYGYAADHKGQVIPFGKGIAGLAAVKRIPLNITGIRRKRDYLSVHTKMDSQKKQSLPGLTDPNSQIAIPLFANNELVAILMAESYNLSVFSKEDELFLIALSQSIAVSIQNAALFDNMEALIAKRTEELHKINQTKDRLFSLISHDLRGPITSFQHIARLMSHYNKQNERDKIDQLSRKVDQSVHKLNTLLNNLLNWALTQTNELRYNPGPANITALLNEVVDLYHDELLRKQITLLHEPITDMVIQADENLLTAIFRNLLSNAIKYTPRGGKINLRIIEDTDHLLIELEDEGMGIAPEKLAAIFEPNEQKSTSGTENEKGTGLGLLVAKEFVEMHRGCISIKSVPGHGTTVSVNLPRL